MKRNERNTRQNSTLLKVDQHIARLDAIIEKLLADLSFEDLSSHERFDILTRFLDLSQRALTLRQTCEIDESESPKETLITALAGYMVRKEEAVSVNIVETGPAPSRRLMMERDDEDDGDENDENN